jgi:hypothetical protein
MKNGLREKARQQWKKSLEIDPEQTKVKQKLQELIPEDNDAEMLKKKEIK